MCKNISIIIQARIGSARLYGKVMKEICGFPVLWHVVNRIKKSNYATNIIVATTENKEDDEVYEYCKKNNIAVFRGSSSDVLDRYYQCAKKFNCENIVRITGDCPLHDAKVIDKVISTYLNGNYDYVANTFEYTYPDGLDAEVFSFDVLEEAWEKAKLASEREHVTPYIKKNDKLKKINVIADKKYPIYRLTIDCPEDYKMINSVYEGIGKLDFGLDETVEFLKQYPQIVEINNCYELNEGYSKSLQKDMIIK
ncbi:glycosyltransferase family protein [Clostridium estertheticum]|uniref:glycosyltransferase family protein n=1 Tax=Clostridium estertheticum TaxID=238834 RepID=UPI001CF5116D|nr:glycosyltransferase family protein [Clostridium estertheticum]MCB2340755.1 glycosyltransferase family protein [Clostridium estertheticum]